jgi:tetratricopeptide (TPR) repeat protein
LDTVTDSAVAGKRIAVNRQLWSIPGNVSRVSALIIIASVVVQASGLPFGQSGSCTGATCDPEELGSDSDWTNLNQQVADQLRKGLVAEAERLLEDGIRSARRNGDTSPGLAGALNDLGTLYHDSGSLLKAERAYKESIAIWAQAPFNPPRMGITLENLAGLLREQGRTSDAEKLYLDAERVLASGYGVNSPELATSRCGLADVYWETGRFAMARKTAESALTLLETAGPDSQLGVALFLLGKIAWRQNRELDAERLFRRAIQVWRDSLGAQDSTYASGLTCLAVVLSRKEPREADRLFREALEVIEKRLGPDHAFTGTTLVLYAKHLEASGRKREARDLRRRGEAILSENSRDNLLGHTVDAKTLQWQGAR